MSHENHDCALINMSCFKKAEQAVTNQMICEPTGADLDKTEHTVAGKANSE